eukprot:CAMPEP_0183713820 /NCGR_PEP_ID=MMETSP0737-20130205/8562_1 /TAXON_ID=385413 /ORGANISM="Thalassiosira miniscula, Strain CCMP1093" /LENGTH=78 /DNA_ID=CAMNT_0025942669 /DNA_START=1 /DNA_END=234 /DNA_ORIENTATION=+
MNLTSATTTTNTRCNSPPGSYASDVSSVNSSEDNHGIEKKNSNSVTVVPGVVHNDGTSSNTIVRPDPPARSSSMLLIQ